MQNDTDHISRPVATALPTNNMALISLISGILGWTIFQGIGAIIAIITGHLAKQEIKESGGTLGGDGLATIGLILGYTNLVMSAIAICVVFFFFGLFFLIPIFGVALEELGALWMVLSLL